MEYMVVEADSKTELESRVSGLLSQGWKPHSGVCVLVWERVQFRYFQAMTRQSIPRMGALDALSKVWP